MRLGLAGSVCILILVIAGDVHAKDYRIEITSEPEGATVFVDARDSDEVGVTPYSGTLSPGLHTIILQLEGHEELVEQIDVGKKRKRQTFDFELIALELATVQVVAGDDGAADGAEILLNGDEAGTVPKALEIEEGAHQIEVTKDGYEHFEEWVEVLAGNETELVVRLVASGKNKKKTGPSGPRAAPVLIAGGAFEIGWRRYSYENPRTESARPFAADVVPVFHLMAELYPLAGRSGALKGIGLTIDAALAAPPAADTNAGMTVQTGWNDLDVGLRYQHKSTDGSMLAGEVAYGRTRFSFADAGALVDEVPDVDYKLIRLGLEGGFQAGKWRLFAGAGYLSVLSAGALADRFRAADVRGVVLRAGIARALFGNMEARIVGAYRRFGYDFDSQPGDAVEADGGLDLFYGVLIGVAYHY